MFSLTKPLNHKEKNCPLPTQQIPKNKQSGVAYVSLRVFIEAKNASIKRSTVYSFPRERAYIINKPIKGEDISFFSLRGEFFTIVPYFEIYSNNVLKQNTIFQIPDNDGSSRSN